MKVDLGGGLGSTDAGWIAVNVNPALRPDVKASVDQLPFADASVDALNAVDVLEHLSYRDTDTVLREWARVTKRGGGLFVQAPDAELIMRWFVQSPHKLLAGLPGQLPQTALAGAAWRLLGGHADGVYVRADGDWRWNAHYAMFSTDSLAVALHTAGWRIDTIQTNPFPNLQAWAIRV